MQSYRDYHHVYHSLNISPAVVKILGLAIWWLWQDFSQEVIRVPKYFPFDILIVTLTSIITYLSNLKNQVAIYIAYQYAALIRDAFASKAIADLGEEACGGN